MAMYRLTGEEPGWLDLYNVAEIASEQVRVLEDQDRFSKEHDELGDLDNVISPNSVEYFHV